MHRDIVVEVDHHLVHIAPAPSFRRIIALHHRMLRYMKVLRGMASLRLVTATHVAADTADPQMHPATVGCETLLAAIRRRPNGAKFIEV
jgi:hypothetical protein